MPGSTHPQPQDAYGLEKLASEELAIHYGKDFGMETRIARFHNIYGPLGTWKGGREKAPAAFCRKVCRSEGLETAGRSRGALAGSQAPLHAHRLGQIHCTSPMPRCLAFSGMRQRDWVSPSCCGNVHALLPNPLLFSTYSSLPTQVLTSKDELEMWGDGLQTRSFTFIDDCVEGILRITKSDFTGPLNLGSDEMVSMNGMMEMVLGFNGKSTPIRHIPGPEGVRGRNSDNQLIREQLGWAPSITLRDGLRITYDWIKVGAWEMRRVGTEDKGCKRAGMGSAGMGREVDVWGLYTCVLGGLTLE